MGTVYHISTDLQRHTATNKPWSEGISVTYTRRSEPPPAGRLRRAKPSSTAQHRHPLDPPTEPRLQRSWHTHLTQSSAPFPVSLTTTVFSQRSTRWFGTSRRRAVPKGLPSSLAQHRI